MPDLDRDLFNKRLKRLYTHWQSNTENIDGICVVTGGDSESSYYKTTAIQVKNCLVIKGVFISKEWKLKLFPILAMVVRSRNNRHSDSLPRQARCVCGESEEDQLLKADRGR